MAESPCIALFGGTFDPVHVGHLAMAQAAHEALGLDQVRFIPCQISPHKQDRQPTTAEHRLRMLELATVDHEWALVDDFETHGDGPSFSWMTAETMQSHFPDAKLFWIMGGDQWKALHLWAEPDRLAVHVEFIVFHRGEELEARDGYRLHALPEVHDAGATQIREQISNGEKDHSWLDPKVAAYIEEHKLYQA